MTLTASATAAGLGGPVSAAAVLAGGTNPGGQITFAAYAPSNAACSGAAAFTSTVAVTGNGPYASAPFVPAQAGAFRWIVAYSGDGFHPPAATACGIATSTVAKAVPAIVAAVKRKLTVGDTFQVKALLSGAQAPTGLVTFTVYGPNPSGCGRPLAVDKVKVSAAGPTLSDPFTAERPGRYLFVAEYSGDASNQVASQACEAAGTAAVGKRKPRLKPRARRKGRRIVIGARLANAVSPTGKIRFRLYGPGDNSCHRKPAFGGAQKVGDNGYYSLAKYFAHRRGTYRLRVIYSGDATNKRSAVSCKSAKHKIRIRWRPSPLRAAR